MYYVDSSIRSAEEKKIVTFLDHVARTMMVSLVLKTNPETREFIGIETELTSPLPCETHKATMNPRGQALNIAYTGKSKPSSIEKNRLSAYILNTIGNHQLGRIITSESLLWSIDILHLYFTALGHKVIKSFDAGFDLEKSLELHSPAYYINVNASKSYLSQHIYEKAFGKFSELYSVVLLDPKFVQAVVTGAEAADWSEFLSWAQHFF